MDVLRQWAVCLIIAAAAGTFAMAISPRGSMDKTVRAVVGIFVVAAICSPLTELKNFDFSVEAMADYEYESANTEELYEQMIAACRNAVEAQVKNHASGIGAEVITVEAEISVDDTGCIIIHKITVEIADLSEKFKADLKEKLQSELGVPVTVNAE